LELPDFKQNRALHKTWVPKQELANQRKMVGSAHHTFLSDTYH
jgi:hypothetical protein